MSGQAWTDAKRRFGGRLRDIRTRASLTHEQLGARIQRGRQAQMLVDIGRITPRRPLRRTHRPDAPESGVELVARDPDGTGRTITATE